MHGFMEVKEIEYEGFGRCVQISNGIIDCAVTIEFGPRIIRFGFCGGENIFYTDPERIYSFHSEAAAAPSGTNADFHLYGGHRVRLSPENLQQNSLPDNSPVVYAALPEGVAFTPPRPKQSEIQLSLEVIMGDGASDIMVVHSAKNCSKEVQTCGLCPITMLRRGGTAVIPQNQDPDPQLPNRMLALWADADARDPRILLGERFLTVRQEPGNPAPLKLGTNDVPGWAAYLSDESSLLKRFLHNPQAAYPDFGCSCEVRLTGDFTELCSLSPLFRVEPGEGIKHVENLSLFRSEEAPDLSDEDKIAGFIDGLH